RGAKDGREGAPTLRAGRREPAQEQGRGHDLVRREQAPRARGGAGFARGRASVSRDESDETEVPHPRETTVLFGHAEVERKLLAGYRSGRIAHAWLIGGPAGIGKATLAYRMARFVLAYPDPGARAVQDATSLAVPPEAPAARRIAGQAHPDLLVLERTVDDHGKMRTVITVDQVRRTVGFFGSTAGEGGWRVCIVDSADE